jgi:hypothetical protein
MIGWPTGERGTRKDVPGPVAARTGRAHAWNVPDQPYLRHPIGQSLAATHRPSRVGRDPAGGGVEPGPGALAERDVIKPPPGDQEDLGHRVLGVGSGRAPPAAIRGNIDSVCLEQRVETLPTARLPTHTAPGDRAVHRAFING